MLKRYVLGFAFNRDLSEVLLIKKTRPEWQKNRMNGIGGHIESGELSCEAMVREFVEETGITTCLPWKQYAVLRGDTWIVDIYNTVAGVFVPMFITTEEGTVSPASVADLKNQPVLPNLLYLIPMAINHIQGTDKCRFFTIQEG